MKIRNKILVYFSSTVVIIAAISLTIVYVLFSAFREEAFQHQQHSKIKQTIEFIQEFEKMNERVADAIDQQTISDFYDEKLLIYNQNKQLIFSSLDDLPIQRKNELLSQLSPAKRWIETKDGDYDLIGVYIEKGKDSFYAISKAYDAVGYSKKNFLGRVLLIIFFSITLIIVLISIYLSSIISKPISILAEKISKYNPNEETNESVQLDTTTLELQDLARHYNQLLKRTEEAFSFQRQSIHHISHELKTPLAIMVSELEIVLKEVTNPSVQKKVNEQIMRAKSLGTIINSLLEIAKLEAGQQIALHSIRIDEVIFDVIEQLRINYPHFNFEVNYLFENMDEQTLYKEGNKELIYQVFYNLLSNCVHYSADSKAGIFIDTSPTNQLEIRISNSGELLSEEEQKQLFTHFFRGKNSKSKPGFGIGLELTLQILHYHQATIIYDSSQGLNDFIIKW